MVTYIVDDNTVYLYEPHTKKAAKMTLAEYSALYDYSTVELTEAAGKEFTDFQAYVSDRTDMQWEEVPATEGNASTKK